MSESIIPADVSGKFKVQPKQAAIIIGAALVLLLAYRYYKNHFGSSPAAAPAASGSPLGGNAVDPTTGQVQANQPNPVPVINVNITNPGGNPSTPPPKPGPHKPPVKPPAHKPPAHKPPAHKPPGKKPPHGGRGGALTQSPSRYSISSELVDNHSGLVASPSAPTPPTGIQSLNTGGGNFS